MDKKAKFFAEEFRERQNEREKENHKIIKQIEKDSKVKRESGKRDFR